MGRRTWESLPKKPLPGRQNIVVSATLTASPQGAIVVPTLEAALEACAGASRAFIIGGAALYAAALPLATVIELTRVHRQVAGDTFFPAIDPFIWKEIAREDHEGFSFVTLTRATGGRASGVRATGAVAPT
jgi:dihydrofolate reductase